MLTPWWQQGVAKDISSRKWEYPHDYALWFWRRLRPAGNQSIRDQDRSPAENGGAFLSQGAGDAAGLAEGAVALYRRRRPQLRRFHLHPRPYRTQIRF